MQNETLPNKARGAQPPVLADGRRSFKTPSTVSRDQRLHSALQSCQIKSLEIQISGFPTREAGLGARQAMGRQQRAASSSAPALTLAHALPSHPPGNILIPTSVDRCWGRTRFLADCPPKPRKILVQPHLPSSLHHFVSPCCQGWVITTAASWQNPILANIRQAWKVKRSNWCEAGEDFARLLSRRKASVPAGPACL